MTSQSKSKLSNLPTYAENATFVLNWLNEHGFTAKPGSRFQRMSEVLQSKRHDFDSKEFWLAHESFRDLVELGFIAEQLDNHVSDPGFQERMKKLLHDKPLSKDDQNVNSAGRDAHWELYLAAVCESADLTPIGFKGNDVTCTVGNHQIGIEAKRIKSEKSVKKRIKKAIDQVERSQRLGVVAIDMSLAWNQQNHPVMGDIHNAFIDMRFDAQARQFIDRHKAWIEPRCKEKGVIGIVIFNFMIRLRKMRWRPHRHAFWFDLTKTDEESRIFQEFEKKFRSVTPNRQIDLNHISNPAASASTST